jgi:BlaI family penicillinase repressor
MGWKSSSVAEVGELTTKGRWLTRQRQERAYLYRPVQPKSLVISILTNDFVTRVFEGSAKPLVLNLLRDQKLSDEDLKEISRCTVWAPMDEGAF